MNGVGHLSAVSALTASPVSAKTPLQNKSFTFSVQLVDLKATSATDRTLELSLSAGNDLTFRGGAKAVTRVKKVGATAVSVTFNETVSGTGEGISSFRVTLRELPSNTLAACFVGLE